MNRRKFFLGTVAATTGASLAGISGTLAFAAKSDWDWAYGYIDGIKSVKKSRSSVVQQAREYIESFYPIGPSTRIAWAMTGEPYVVLNIGWGPFNQVYTKEEGFPFGAEYYGATEELALDAMKEAFRGYISDKPKNSTLYWRERPTLEQHPKTKTFNFYCRLLVSDKPENYARDMSKYKWAFDG